MIMIKYSKMYPVNMISHIDLLRLMNRLTKRCGINVEYSQGFNPHILMYFSPPLSLGTQSQCEYMCVATKDKSDDTIISRLNAVSPKGLVFISAIEVDANPNLANEVKWAKYIVSAENIGKIDTKSILDSSQYVISFKGKEKIEEKDVRPLILSINSIDSDNLEVIIACGNSNLRADRLIDFMSKEKQIGSVSILKTDMYVNQQINVDTFLSNVKRVNA